MSENAAGDRRIAAATLADLIARFPAAADDPDFLEAALRDLFGDKLRRERELLVAAARAGVPRSARAAAGPIPGFDAADDDAQWAVGAWHSALAGQASPRAALTEPMRPVSPLPAPRPRPARRPRNRVPVFLALAACAVAAILFAAYRAHAREDAGAFGSSTAPPQAGPSTADTAAPATPDPGDATDAPATDDPATDAPATDAPADSAATDAPATDEPATDAPATDAPATDAPATDAPATDAPATDAPATDAPATDAPATDVPATQAPATGETASGNLANAPSALDACIDAWNAHDWKAAKIACRRAAGDAPNDAEIELLLGESDYACGSYWAAIRPLGAALQLAGTRAQKLEAHRYRGFVYYELYRNDGDMNHLEAAFDDLGAALDIDDGDAATIDDYGVAAYRLGRWCSAARAFETLAQRDPGDRHAAHRRDLAERKRERYGCT